MPVYKLYYFDDRGRAEATRLCFAAAGVKYEDVRLTDEEWQQKMQGLWSHERLANRYLFSYEEAEKHGL